MELNELFHPDIVKVLKETGIHNLDDLQNFVNAKINDGPMTVYKSTNVAFGFLSGYISGFSTCMQWHTTPKEQTRMLFYNEGKPDYCKSVIQMLKDYGKSEPKFCNSFALTNDAGPV